ncbi:Sulfotransferase domain protein [Botrimarina hoheduenensis]|uniref:Sulfotransferase domain protein n=1 Tax=Botrimarina hoheduenensis TaxID=2528000 RepID=A0A5C5W0B9_9BACT|nr:Sulfotransferase domain protein [Botrimarina hoheduenensis]
MPSAAPSNETASARSGEHRKQGYGVDPVHKYGLMAPRFWHGMTPDAFWRLAHRGGYRFSVRGVATAAAITGVGLGHWAGEAVQSLLHRKRIERVRLDQAPLFVLGHWRSGTTLLHELLIRDTRNTFPTTYQCFAPKHFLVTEDWLPGLTRWLLPNKRPMDNMPAGWDRPQEDEFALCSLGVPTPYMSWAFPDQGPVYREWLTLDVSDEDRRRWAAALQRFVHTVALRRQGRVVLKSPPHTARVKTLLEIFPEARFVHIARDPLSLFPSTVRLWKSLSDVQSLGPARQRYDWIEEEVLANLNAMYKAYERDLPLIPAGRLAELRYEDLIADPQAQMRNVYNTLDLPGFEDAERAINAYFAAQREYKTNRFELPAEVQERVNQRWQGYAKRFGYQ